MIKGFEEYTPDIKQEDLPTVNMIAEGLRKRIGKERAISNKGIRDSFLEKKGIHISGPFVRKAIQFIRMKRMIPFLVASNKGYHVAESEQEFREYVESYKARIRAMEATYSAMNRDL